jgi:prepilin-type N-terminal cleavage/methylation domain-containing protein
MNRLYKNNQKRFTLRNSKGFTLVEIIVVVFIFAVVSSILLFRYSDFSTNVSVRNLSQEVALSIRKAQTLATSVRGGNPRDVFNATRGYGVYVSVPPSTALIGGGDSSFVIFRDDNGDGRYNQRSESCGRVTSNNECLERFTITTGDRISQICVDDNCSSPSGVVIYFRRPSPDAKIYFENSPTQLRSYADITLVSRKGLRKTVRVWNTGQIGVLP